MREILFRGKRVGDGDWVGGYFFAKPELGVYFIQLGGSQWMVDPETVGQYTGLKDKNGNWIFEGDVVRLYFVDCEEIGEIVWDEEQSKFAYRSPDGAVYGVDGTVEFEILGNIHDNPELLED